MNESFLLNDEALGLMRESFLLNDESLSLMHEARRLTHESFLLIVEPPSLTRESFCLNGLACRPVRPSDTAGRQHVPEEMTAYVR